MKKYIEPKSVILRSNLELIPNIYELKKIGAGHDGEVYKYKTQVLKLLKYDLETRKRKQLMTFDKALYFQEELNLKRIVKPTDILLDSDGNYTGYCMNYLNDLSKKTPNNNIKTIGDYSIEQLISSILDLRKDFNNLSKKNVVGKDINKGSFLLTKDFLYLCDMDKYQMNVLSAKNLNDRNLNFVVSKLLYFEMFDFIDKQDRKTIINWIKFCCNDKNFIDNLLKELSNETINSVHEYTVKKSKILLR